MLADRFGQRDVSNFSIEDGFEFGIATRDGIADNHEVDVVGDVICAEAFERRDALGGEKLAHRRIHVLVRPAHIEPAMFEQGGECAHCRPADPDEVDGFRHRYSTADSSMTSAARPFVTTRASTPNGNVQVADLVWPDGNPNSTGPRHSAANDSATCRAVTS